MKNKFWAAAGRALAAVTVTLIVTLILVPSSAGQSKFKTLQTFNPADYKQGTKPVAGLIFDTAGNLYGTTKKGGAKTGCGTVFKLSPKPDGSWSKTVLYRFLGRGDGCQPYAGAIFDKQGNLYGTTVRGLSLIHI